MRAASPSLIAFLQSRAPYWSADLFTITPLAGSIIYLTGSDRDIVANGNTYSAMGPTIQRSRWSVKNTLDVPDMDIQIYSTGSDLAIGNIKKLIYQGFLDGAYVQLDRAFVISQLPPDCVVPFIHGDVSLGTVLLFGGRTSEVQISALGVKLKVKGDNVLMQQYMPRNLYQLGCIHSLYDSGCGLSRAAFTFPFTVGAGATAAFIPWGAAPANPEYFTLGGFELTAGSGLGQIRTVLASDSTGLSLAYPLYTIPAPGDAFAAYYGCNKARGANGEATPNCTTPFNNVQNFRGFPFIPPAETAFRWRNDMRRTLGRRNRSNPLPGHYDVAMIFA